MKKGRGREGECNKGKTKKRRESRRRKGKRMKEEKEREKAGVKMKEGIMKDALRERDRGVKREINK